MNKVLCKIKDTDAVKGTNFKALIYTCEDLLFPCVYQMISLEPLKIEVGKEYAIKNLHKVNGNTYLTTNKTEVKLKEKTEMNVLKFSELL